MDQSLTWPSWIGVFCCTLLACLAAGAVGAQGSEPLPDELQKILQQQGLSVSLNEIQSESGVAAAILVPQVFARDVTVTRLADGSLSGSFTVFSRENSFVGDIGYDLLVLGPEPTPVAGQLQVETAPIYDRSQQPERFSLVPQGSKTVTFSYRPLAVPTGDYRLRVQLKTSNGREMGWETVPIQLDGAAAFAVLEPQAVETSSQTVVTGEARSTWGPLEGVNVDPGQELVLNLQARSVGSGPVAVKPVVRLERILDASISPIEISGEVFDLTVSGSQEVRFPLTAAAGSGPYTATLALHDLSGVRISTLADFRYVVRGLSASVVSAKVVALGDRPGEQAVIEFTVVGAADRETNERGIIEVAVREQGEILGATTDEVQLNAGAVSGTASLVLEKGVTSNPEVVITLKSAAGTVLDSYVVPFADVVRELQISPQPSGQQRSYRTLAVAIALTILALVIGIAWLAMRKRQTPLSPPPAAPLAILVTLTLAGILAWHSAPSEASGVQYRQSWWQGGWGAPQLTLFVNKPQHGSTIVPGPVPYEISLFYVACANSYHVGSISVYTQDGESWKQQVGYTLPWSMWLRVNGLLDMAGFAPGSSTTVWTRATGYATYRTGWSYGIVDDYTTLHFASPTPTPTPTVTVTSSPSPGGSPTITPLGSPAVCSDNQDNDNDGRIDIHDPACHSDRKVENQASYQPQRTSEVDVECSDIVDNADTEDTLADSADPGCHTDRNASSPATYNPADNNEQDDVPDPTPGGFGPENVQEVD